MFLFKEKVYSFQKGYSPEYSNYSPGNILLVLNLQELIGEKAKMVDFLRGEHEYKLRWASRLDINRNIILASDPLGSLFLKIISGREEAKGRAAQQRRRIGPSSIYIYLNHGFFLLTWATHTTWK